MLELKFSQSRILYVDINSCKHAAIFIKSQLMLHKSHLIYPQWMAITWPRARHEEKDAFHRKTYVR